MKHFVRQLAHSRELKGETCIGDEICAVKGPQVKYVASGLDPLLACAGCNLRHTKPGWIEPGQEAQPIWLNLAHNTAIELDLLERSGATFSYPDALTPYEWVCIGALRKARDEDEEKEHRKAKEKAEREAMQRRLSGK